MNKKIVSEILLTLLLIGLLSLSFNIRQVEASGTIYIKADGSVDPPTAPIHSVDNITYVFTDNIYDEIVVERNSIVLDGADYTLQGPESGCGIYLYSRIGMTIRNVTVKGWRYGIKMCWSNGNTICSNTLTNNYVSIKLERSNHNTISANTITDTVASGIVMDDSDGNIVSGNAVTNSVGLVALWGLVGGHCNYNTIFDNTVTNCTGVDIAIMAAYGGGGGKNNISRNTLIGNSVVGIMLWETEESTISENIVMGHERGIHLYDCTANIFYHNDIINNTIQARMDFFHGYKPNYWHHPDLLEGNYWSDYTGADDGSGVGKHAIADDGIGDTLIPHPGAGYDFYPLMEPWTLKPSTPIEASEELVETIQSWNLTGGTENSLTSKLDDVIHLLEKGNDNGAIHKLMDFIDQVEGLKGKKLTDEQADYLIAEAQRIIDLIQG